MRRGSLHKKIIVLLIVATWFRHDDDGKERSSSSSLTEEETDRYDASGDIMTTLSPPILPHRCRCCFCCRRSIRSCLDRREGGRSTAVIRSTMRTKGSRLQVACIIICRRDGGSFCGKTTQTLFRFDLLCGSSVDKRRRRVTLSVLNDAESTSQASRGQWDRERDNGDKQCGSNCGIVRYQLTSMVYSSKIAIPSQSDANIGALSRPRKGGETAEFDIQRPSSAPVHVPSIESLSTLSGCLVEKFGFALLRFHMLSRVTPSSDSPSSDSPSSGSHSSDSPAPLYFLTLFLSPLQDNLAAAHHRRTPIPPPGCSSLSSLNSLRL